MPSASWNKTKERVYQRANGCCEYCCSCEINIGQTLHVEHINPFLGDSLDNLCLACPNCNLAKASAVKGYDPVSKEEHPLFNPRIQRWEDHFIWGADYSVVNGVTEIGRATVTRLKINRPRMVMTRRRWVQGGLHPVV